jgi:hypothetical protein
VGEILTPESPRWDEFYDVFTDTYTVCDHEHVYRCAKKVMAKMGGIDIEGSLSFFREHGGYCDHEILLNVLLVLLSCRLI